MMAAVLVAVLYDEYPNLGIQKAVQLIEPVSNAVLISVRRGSRKSPAKAAVPHENVAPCR